MGLRIVLAGLVLALAGWWLLGAGARSTVPGPAPPTERAEASGARPPGLGERLERAGDLALGLRRDAPREAAEAPAPTEGR